ncbi:hypothetical protein WR25_17249 [Diploscapter pachys]|uniref:DNA helicase Pif1-like 2B domain-containing protein n=1 Tax=Diploscapter pachys TaxID=2018661 RepID=A0A2A2J422_9BILA|nr:hypothetical protein WR25_17249 [Diploscapter pachys]
MGNGKIPADKEGYIKIPDAVISKRDLVEEVFGECIANKDFDLLSRRVILTTTNERVHELNARVLELIGDEEEKIYLSVDTVDSNEPNTVINYPPEFLHSYNESGLPPHELKLKVNSPVILKRNLNPSAGLCNGTRLRVKCMHQHLIECEFITGERTGQRVLIPRITLTSGKGNLPFVLHRRQFPVTLCYAMTINKSQGQTIDFAGLDLETSVFSHGMAYVAFSRVRAWEYLRVKTSEEKEGKVKNIVWKEVLLTDDNQNQNQTSQNVSQTTREETQSQRSQEL